jgi:hypothetical protein
MRYDFSEEYTIKIRGTPEQIKEWIKEISHFMDKGVSYMMMEKELANFDNLENIVAPVEFVLGDVHKIRFKSKYLKYTPTVDCDDKKIYFEKFKILFDYAKIKMDKKHRIKCNDNYIN